MAENEEAILRFKAKTGEEIALLKDKTDYYLQFRFVNPQGDKIEFPKPKPNSWKQFKYSHRVAFLNNGKQVDVELVRFKIGDDQYVIYEQHDRGSGSTSAGLKISNSDTNQIKLYSAISTTIQGDLSRVIEGNNIEVVEHLD
ncbi:hypothetical protein CHX27_06975 [Flavobacterium aurantiibacter]|uniref:Uncharacterized protein n=1 Tax=Flavobacterium aurantiibacter TaxID=2023067 RepID=A0A255ZV98_9FLAO|nr:hypothetical protein CHX27_06975 [Flavobacterium aurantiibacter]